ncbi:MAG: hypothetical protein AAF958_15995 [Planctomycetota bacterium]
MIETFRSILQFEIARTLTPARITLWLLLTLFPMLLVGGVRALLLIRGRMDLDPETFANMIFYLIPHVTCQLGLLLWATPAVGAEVEGQTWLYLATKPAGKSMILIGKYITAVLWTLSSGWIAVWGCALILNQFFSGRIAAVMSLMVLFSCLGFGSIYLLIGSILHRRAMVVAMLYTLMIEGVLGFLPATINRFTVSYRLRNLMIDWMEVSGPFAENEYLYQPEAAPVHLAAIATHWVVTLVLAVVILNRREIPINAEA